MLILASDHCRVSLFDGNPLSLLCCHYHSTASGVFCGNYSNWRQGLEINEVNSVILRFLNNMFALVLMGFKHKFTQALLAPAGGLREREKVALVLHIHYHLILILLF